MRIYITGATGYIGGAIARAARDVGHEVLALAHTADVSHELTRKGFTPVSGNLTDLPSLARHAQSADATIHAGFVGGANGAEIDRLATETMVTALEGLNRPFIYTSGVWVLGHTDAPTNEQSPHNSIALVAWRARLEEWLVAAAQRGVATVIVRPGIAFGNGGGIPGSVSRGAIPLVDTGRQRWSVVHVDDLAELYLAALVHATPGSVLHGVGAVLPAIDLVERESIGVPDIHFVPLDTARETLGDFADALALDQNVSAELTTAAVGWHPSRLPATLVRL